MSKKWAVTTCVQIAIYGRKKQSQKRNKCVEANYVTWSEERTRKRAKEAVIGRKCQKGGRTKTLCSYLL